MEYLHALMQRRISGCSSASCLADFRKRERNICRLSKRRNLDLVGIINCSGCPTLTGADKLLQRIRALTEFSVMPSIFTYCMKALCPFKEKYKAALEEAFPNIKIIIGTITGACHSWKNIGEGQNFAASKGRLWLM